MLPLSFRRRAALVVAFCAGLAAPVPAFAWSEREAAEIWSELSDLAFEGRPIVEDSGVVGLEAPTRAQDPGSVPVTVSTRLSPLDGRRIEKISLFVDENPAPLVAVFELGETANIAKISTNVRVNRYSLVHAVAELDDGSLHAASAFVKASGGCSARPVERPEVAAARLGELDFEQGAVAGAAGSAMREDEIRVMHPNYTGMQLHYVTLNYIPARYVDTLTVTLGSDPLLKVTGGISLSENPAVRLSYRPAGEGDTFVAEMRDTSGTVTTARWPLMAGGS